MADVKRLVALETKLIEELGGTGIVDGHDFRIGEFSIMISTNEPKTTFTQAHHLIVRAGVVNHLRSAYRERNGEYYIVLWPSRLSEFSVY